MSWVVVVAVIWLLVALALGWLIGRSIRLADKRDLRHQVEDVPDIAFFDNVAADPWPAEEESVQPPSSTPENPR